MTILNELMLYTERCIDDVYISDDEDYISGKKHKWACRRFLDDIKKSEAKKATLDGSGLDVKLRTKTIEGAGIKSNKTYTLTATDDRDAKATKTTAITFLNGVYYGVGTAVGEAINNDFVKGLTKKLSGSKAETFTVNAAEGNYIYYALPKRLGTPTFFVGGFEGGFALEKTFDYTNPSGYTESYDVYKSTNAGLGSTKVDVK